MMRIDSQLMTESENSYDIYSTVRLKETNICTTDLPMDGWKEGRKERKKEGK